MRLAVLVLGALTITGCTPPASEDTVPAELSRPEGRSIELSLVVESPPDDVFAMWAGAEGSRRFFSPAAHIGAGVGDPYVIVFDPVNDPEGANHGTKGGEILAVEPGRRLAFTWTFPPFGPEFNTKPFPTWVEITVESFADEPGRTLMHFAHRGFPLDESWDEVFAIFRDGNWPLVLNRLLVYCRDGVSPAWGQEDGDHLDRFLLKEATVAAPAAEVWQAWTTDEGLEGFLCEQATVELRTGGSYEILFSMSAPEGERGAEGCQVVDFEPGKWLTFTWNSPPSLPEVRSLRTNVNIQLQPTDDGATTRVRLLAIGWGSGEQWVASHQYFDNAWDSVLEWLGRSFAGIEEP